MLLLFQRKEVFGWWGGYEHPENPIIIFDQQTSNNEKFRNICPVRLAEYDCLGTYPKNLLYSNKSYSEYDILTRLNFFIISLLVHIYTHVK